jgi:serine/threonine protein kinase
MSKLIEDVTERNASLTLTEGGSARWLAPELIEGKALGKEADVYSFAMAVLELLSEKHPYPECKRDAQVIHRIVVQKKPPERPKNEAAEVWLSDGLWDLMRRCWHKDASARPSMGEVSACAQEINHTYATLTESPQLWAK